METAKWCEFQTLVTKCCLMSLHLWTYDKYSSSLTPTLLLCKAINQGNLGGRKNILQITHRGTSESAMWDREE